MALVGAPFAPFASRHGGPRPSAASTFVRSSCTGSANDNDDGDHDDDVRSGCAERLAELDEAKDKHNSLLLGPGTSWQELGSKTTAATSLSLTSSKLFAAGPQQGQGSIGLSTSASLSLWPSEPSGLRGPGGLVNTKDFGHQVASQGTSEIVLPQLSPRSRVPKGVTLLNCETGEQVFLSAESFSLGQNIALAKSFVAEKADMSANKMEILWSGQILEGSRTFSSYGVKAGDVLSVSTSRRRHRMADGGGNRGFGPGVPWGAGIEVAAQPKTNLAPSLSGNSGRTTRGRPAAPATPPVTLFLLDARSGRKQPLPDSVGLGMKVSVVKEIVSYLIGLPAVDMQLCWNGLVLHEGRSLAAYHIQSGQCLHAKRLPSYSDAPQRLQLTILSMESHGKLAIPPFFVEASPMDLVFRVKEKITAAVGIPVSEQRLVFVGRSLSNFSTLEQVGISSDVTLQLALPFEELPDRNLMERNAVLSEHSSSIVIDKARFFLTLHELWPTGRQYRCAVLPDAPISAIRERAAQEAGCLPSDLVLVHYGMKLRDGLNPNFYNLQVGDIIDVAKKPLPIKPPDERPPKGVSASPRKPRAGDLRKSADAISSHSSSSPTSDEAGGAADQQQQQQQQQQ
eukprot:CAMPEP_0206576430 /NCGR_PEP_ID=MMETSP0325_2-20121206/30739_1 /ASSEMBLY_ACC=CAM_ASM_000347 /TAXON_ID=2866 /ORGANISM="Crypthecodinium cohnii, Strain Seligo" /LENGTH=623 /DNA_ID=CAMNT_0054081629 /DNA_START=193 /DNA_END=2060 /DNA_ORIENTATION=+